MNHISSKWLRKLRWLYLAYSAHFLVVYLYIGFTYNEWGGTHKFPIATVFLLGVQFFYEIYASFKLTKKHAYLATYITTFFLLFETAVVFNPSGVYYSPYALVYIVMAFLMGSLGWYGPVVLLVTMLLFSIFGFSGFVQSPVPITTRFEIFGSVELFGVALFCLLGYHFWRRYYDLSENSDLKRLNARLKRGAQQSTTILNSIGDGVIVFDSTGLVDLINPQASAMTGFDPKEALGMDIRKILKYSNPDPESGDAQLPDLIEQSMKDKNHVNRNVKLDSPKLHSTIIVSLSISPIIIPPDNELVGGVTIMHDITKEQEIEKQRNDFISTASHEMRTPLATIEGYLDLALTDKKVPIKEPVRGYIESAHKSTEHLGKLFQDLLSSSRAEDGSLTNKPEVIELREFLDQFMEDFRYSTKKYGLGFEFTDTSEVTDGSKGVGVHIVKPKYYVYADPERLRELVNNLFDNAIKFTQKGKVTVGISANHDAVQLYMKDTGVGIPGEDIYHLFQKFYRVDNSPTRTIGGTGLGLFICRKIVELYGGRIWVESNLGEGSTFFVNLPRLTDKQVKELGAPKAKALGKVRRTATEPVVAPTSSIAPM